MQSLRFSATRRIQAPPAVVWDILADYRHGHPLIIPQRAFSDFVVEAGGYGEGTIIRFTFKAAGTTRQAHQRVSTPEPGRVLVERDIVGTGQTSFTLTAQDQGRGTQVDIVTEVPSHAGLVGVIERGMVKLVAPTMHKLYLEELDNLEHLAQTWVSKTSHQHDAVH